MSDINKPKLFVGSSRESLPIAYSIQNNLQEALVRVWTQGLFYLTRSTLDNLIAISSEHDFGVFVFSPDDLQTIRKEEKASVRDNVLFEFGLFVGKIGADRTYFILPKDHDKDFHLATDLLGITAVTYDYSEYNKNNQDDAVLGPACNQIRKAIIRLGVINNTDKENVFILELNELKNSLHAGFNNINKTLEDIKLFPEVNKSVLKSKEEIIQNFKDHFDKIPLKSPTELNNNIDRLILKHDVELLIRDDKLPEAEASARNLYETHPTDNDTIETYVGVLLKRKSKDKAELAWDILKSSNLYKTQVYDNVAYVLGEYGEDDKAIESYTKSLDIASRMDKTGKEVSKIKGNIAYFCADIGKTDLEETARKYAKEAYDADPTSAKKDTLGYVKIAYGKTREEILDGLSLCFEAFKEDSRGAKFYEKHNSRALKRITELSQN